MPEVPTGMPRLLLPTHLARTAAALAVLCGAAFVLLGVKFAGHAVPGPFDQAAEDTLVGAFRRGGPELDALDLTTNPVVLVGAIALVTVVCLVRRRYRAALLAALGPAVTVTVNTWVLKPLFDRTYEGYLAFPSGHTASLASLLTVVTLLVAAEARPGRRLLRGGGAALLSLVVVVVAAGTLVGLGYHYLTDTIGATCWAVCAVITVAALIDTVAKRVGDAEPGHAPAPDRAA